MEHSEQTPKRDRSRSWSDAGRRWIAVVVFFVAMAAAVAALLLWPRRDIDERLRAIDAAHAVTDDGNAARHIARLVLDPAVPDLDPWLLPEGSRMATLVQPWRSEDHPEAAKWMAERRMVMDGLLQAASEPNCWFAVADVERPEAKYFTMEYQGAMLLLRAANNDLGEGRTQAALEKVLAVFRWARHLLAQANPSEQMAGWSVAQEGLQRFGEMLVRGDVPADWLDRFEAVMPPTEDAWEWQSRQMDEITGLYVRKRRSFRVRLMYTVAKRVTGRAEMTRHMYHAYVADSRAGRILLALYRWKDQTGGWPDDLAAIEDRIPRDAQLDPLSGRPFVYRATGRNFLLYSVGADGMDEGGQAGDDRLYWP